MTETISQIDREYILAHVLKKPREWIIAHPEAKLRPSQHRRLAALLRRRARGEPLAYLLGEQWFHGRPFTVNRDVLIPRPETESLIELACERVTRSGVPRRKRVRPCRVKGPTLFRQQQDPRACTIIDIGTGSGCIAITLAKELPNARVIAIDTSIAALRVARANARHHNVANRISFLWGNLLAPFLKWSLRARTNGSRAERGNPDHQRRHSEVTPRNLTPWYGVLRLLPQDDAAASLHRRLAPRNDTTLFVLANLPYLTTAEWRALPRSIRDYEPHQALDGGPNGLRYFRALFRQLRTIAGGPMAIGPPLRPLTVFLEIDPRRKRALTALVRKTLPDWEASWHRDLAGRYRVLSIQF